jgi:hypothetical protein
MSAWQSLYIHNGDPAIIRARLGELLTAQGYTHYNPFGRMPSRPYKQTVRLFIAPSGDGWLRVIGELPPSVCLALSGDAPLLALALTAGDAEVNSYRGGEVQAIEEWARHLPGLDAVALDNPAPTALRLAEPPQPMMVPLDALPDDVRKMAQDIDQKQAAKMFERISGDLMKRAGGDAQAAGALLQQQDAPQWNSAGGARLAHIASVLRLSDGWREPDFVTLRDAYQAAARKERSPNAPPFPGDADALARVPDALAYTPVFAGKDA